MEEQEKDLNYIFNEIPLYIKEKFKVFYEKDNLYYYDIDEYKRFYKYISTVNGKIITKCIWCNKEFSFDYEVEMKYLNEYDNFIDTPNFYISRDAFMEFEENGIIMHQQPPYERKELIENNYYINYYIKCNNNPYHCYYMNLLVRLENGQFVVEKVGQCPSMITIKGFNFDKYKKQLNKYNAYEDYKNADLSMVHNFYAGAYTYLRRVYEKQLDYYVKKDKVELEDNHTETKIKAVKSNFDSRITPLLNNLYKILSIGIHELDEEESKDYYEYLKAVIDMQLQYEKEKYEEEQQSSFINKTISNIVNKLNSRK